MTRSSLERRVHLTLSPPGKRATPPAKPTEESLARGEVRRAIEDRKEARRLRGAVDWYAD